MTSKGPKQVIVKDEANILSFAEGFKHFAGDRTAMREALGGKGAGLAEMTAQGINVPPGFTITTNTCRAYNQAGGVIPAGLFEDVFKSLLAVEKSLSRKFGGSEKPLLLSVRSGAKFSMPGMMDTILNLGLNDLTVKALAEMTENRRFALDSYRRLIQMFGNVVLEISKDEFEKALSAVKLQAGAKVDNELTVEQLDSVVEQFNSIILKHTNKPFPQEVNEQLKLAVEAVFKSWNNPRAVYYRNLNKIDHNIGTAVNIQAMVFGNLNNNSATGVCFTRNPSTGEKELYGEYLLNAQGEDVVAGTRTPEEISLLIEEMPEAYAQLNTTVQNLEKHYRDMQDIEFTIENKTLYILQTRAAKRTVAAALKTAVDFVAEKVISKDEALLRIDPLQLNQLLLPSFSATMKSEAQAQGRLLATGLNASPGAAQGKLVFDPDQAEILSKLGEKIILVRIETCPDDIHGIVAAQGVLTSRGGMTSHAAVVARGMGKPCVAGCDVLHIDLEGKKLTANGKTLNEGDLISIDGASGEVFAGLISTVPPNMSAEFEKMLAWADETRRLAIRANADTPEDAKLARQYGAQGVGLCRTEHMFMAQDRLAVMQTMIMADSKAERQSALEQLLPMQIHDFVEIFKVMQGLPVTIRLLDPPLHEFLPKLEDLIVQPDNKQKKALLNKVKELKEANPMMGLRGCRLGLLYPEICQMQVEAIFKAAITVKREGIKVLPEIMIPLISDVQELIASKLLLENAAQKVMDECKEKIDYTFGTMIEIPRACLTADEIAEHADFFSFGTNDLTQMTYGFSRDDAEGKFLTRYLEGIEINGQKIKIMSSNPFETLDREGVGKLVKLAIEYGLQSNPSLKLGICGEHGGEPLSIKFFHEMGLDYVSCSPFRIPVARLAAAQAKLSHNEEGNGLRQDK